MSALIGALTALGIPKDPVLRYDAALRADKVRVIVDGGADDIRHARDVLAAAGSSGLQSHPKAA